LYITLHCKCDGRLFQKLAPETGKTRLPTVERLNGGTASWLEEADRSLCRDGTSVTRVKYDDRYAGALLFKAWKVITAILNVQLPIYDDFWNYSTVWSVDGSCVSLANSKSHHR